jgi:hypothetical protein
MVRRLGTPFLHQFGRTLKRSKVAKSSDIPSWGEMGEALDAANAFWILAIGATVSTIWGMYLIDHWPPRRRASVTFIMLWIAILVLVGPIILSSDFTPPVPLARLGEETGTSLIKNRRTGNLAAKNRRYPCFSSHLSTWG